MSEKIKDEMEYEPTKPFWPWPSKLNGGFKRGELLLFAAGKEIGKPSEVYFLKARTGTPHWTVTLSDKALVLEDIDRVPPATQSENRAVKHRQYVNALLLQTGLSRNKREGRYAFKIEGRHRRIGPGKPRVVHFVVGSRLAKLIAARINQKGKQRKRNDSQ